MTETAGNPIERVVVEALRPDGTTWRSTSVPLQGMAEHFETNDTRRRMFEAGCKLIEQAKAEGVALRSDPIRFTHHGSTSHD